MELLRFVGEQEDVIGVCANTIEGIRLDEKAVRIISVFHNSECAALRALRSALLLTQAFLNYHGAPRALGNPECGETTLRPRSNWSILLFTG